MNIVFSKSDSNFKHDINALDDKYINVLDNMNPVEFKFNDSNEKIHLGYIAQNVQEAIIAAGIDIDDMSIISQAEDGLYLSYDQIIAMLHVKINKQDEEIEELQTELAEVKSEIASIRASLGI